MTMSLMAREDGVGRTVATRLGFVRLAVAVLGWLLLALARGILRGLFSCRSSISAFGSRLLRNTRILRILLSRLVDRLLIVGRVVLIHASVVISVIRIVVIG